MRPKLQNTVVFLTFSSAQTTEKTWDNII